MKMMTMTMIYETVPRIERRAALYSLLALERRERPPLEEDCVPERNR